MNIWTLKMSGSCWDTTIKHQRKVGLEHLQRWCKIGFKLASHHFCILIYIIFKMTIRIFHDGATPLLTPNPGFSTWYWTSLHKTLRLFYIKNTILNYLTYRHFIIVKDILKMFIILQFYTFSIFFNIPDFLNFMWLFE